MGYQAVECYCSSVVGSGYDQRESDDQYPGLYVQ